jgi:hypothetical protein
MASYGRCDPDAGCVDPNLCNAGLAQKNTVETPNPGAFLKMTGTVIKSRFCQFDDGKYTTVRVSVNLRLIFTNTGTYPLSPKARKSSMGPLLMPGISGSGMVPETSGNGWA